MRPPVHLRTGVRVRSGAALLADEVVHFINDLERLRLHMDVEGGVVERDPREVLTHQVRAPDFAGVVVLRLNVVDVVAREHPIHPRVPWVVRDFRWWHIQCRITLAYAFNADLPTGRALVATGVCHFHWHCQSVGLRSLHAVHADGANRVDELLVEELGASRQLVDDGRLLGQTDHLNTRGVGDLAGHLVPLDRIGDGVPRDHVAVAILADPHVVDGAGRSRVRVGGRVRRTGRGATASRGGDDACDRNGRNVATHGASSVRWYTAVGVRRDRSEITFRAYLSLSFGRTPLIISHTHSVLQNDQGHFIRTLKRTSFLGVDYPYCDYSRKRLFIQHLGSVVNLAVHRGGQVIKTSRLRRDVFMLFQYLHHREKLPVRAAWLILPVLWLLHLC